MYKQERLTPNHVRLKCTAPSCTLNFILSQYSLQSGFALARLFHRLPHLWLSTVLLKVHHFISLCFLLFAFFFLLFALLLSLTSCHTSGHIALCHKPCLALRFCHFIMHTHTHTHTLSLSHNFPSAFAFLHSVTSRLHITHLSLTSHTSASHHASQLHVTHLSFTSHILASHSPFGFYYYYFCFSTLALAFSHSVTPLASHHKSQLYITHLSFASHTLLFILALLQAFNY